MIIYKATFPNNKSYIGCTKNKLSVRKANHKYKALKTNRNNIFYKAIREFGFDVINWEILEESDADLFKREAELVSKFKTQNPFGYNETEGGLNPKHTDLIKEKRSINNKRVWLGKRFSAEHKEKISEALTGKKRDYLKHTKNAKKGVVSIDSDGNEVEYISLTEASQKTGSSISGISFTLSGRLKKSNGYYWKYNKNKNETV